MSSFRGRSIALVGVLLLWSCGGSPVDQECSQEQKCGDGPASQTVVECESSWNGCLATLNAGSQACQTLSNAWQAYASCIDGLTCAERAGNVALGSCGNELTNLYSAQDIAQGAMCPVCNGVLSPPGDVNPDLSSP